VDFTKSYSSHSFASAYLVFIGFYWFSPKRFRNCYNFFENNINFSFSVTFLVLVFSHMKIGMGEIFEDYIQDSRYKSVANLIISIFATVLPLITIVSLILIKFN